MWPEAIEAIITVTLEVLSMQYIQLEHTAFSVSLVTRPIDFLEEKNWPGD